MNTNFYFTIDLQLDTFSQGQIWLIMRLRLQLNNLVDIKILYKEKREKNPHLNYYRSVTMLISR